tara:strand:- start:258 stop:473 length:216 start_codon:yes stop_codon:yes gene_type:complete
MRLSLRLNLFDPDMGQAGGIVTPGAGFNGETQCSPFAAGRARQKNDQPVKISAPPMPFWGLAAIAWPHICA